MKRPRARARAERAVVILLGITFVVVAGLLVQSVVSLRSHRTMIQATLGDFSAFAAERVANELDQTFSGLFLDQIALARSAHYRWTSDPTVPTERPEGQRPLPVEAIPFFFSLDGSQLIRHGKGSDPDLERAILEEVLRHLPGYPRPAPYAVLRDHRSTAVVYRKEPQYEGESVYGFVVDFGAFDRWYARVVEETPLLPRSLGDEASAEGLLAVGLHLTPGDNALFSRGAQLDGPTAWAFAAKAGRLAVGVRIDGDRAGSLIAGGASGAGIPVLSGLAVLTLGLLAVAVRLFQRSTRLAGLREHFVANVSHDLRTPITQIRMFSETLLMDRLPDRDEQARSLGIIHRQAEILGDLVDNILHASTNRPELHPVLTPLAPLVRDVIDSFTPPGHRDAASIRSRLSGEAAAVIDPTAMTRILTNLLDNAVRHGGRGDVQVTVDADLERVQITVEDDGPGIAPSDRDRVFERFVQLAADPAGGDTTGAGIGLAVVRELARRHGGDAVVASSSVGGTHIVVTLSVGP